IIDIVEERLDVQVPSSAPGVLGSAIVKGPATEVIDVGHFLPHAFADWFRGKGEGVPTAKSSVLLVDDSPFFLNMLTPVLQAAGYSVTGVGRAQHALDLIANGGRFDVVVTDIDMPELDGFALAERLRAD